MRKFFCLFLAVPLSAAITISTPQVDTDSQEATIKYTTNYSGACSWTVSKTLTGGVPAPVVDDVNTTLFPGSNLDSRPGSGILTNGQFRTMHVGTRGRGYLSSSDSLIHSRSLQAATLYYYQGTCGATTTSVLTFQTTNIPFGLGATDPWPVDPTIPGKFMAPSSPGLNQPSNANPGEQWTDPQTGVLTERVYQPGQSVTIQGPVSFQTAYNQGLSTFSNDSFNNGVDQGLGTCGTQGSQKLVGDNSGTPWANPCYALSAVTNHYAAEAGSTGWLVIRPNNYAFFSNFSANSLENTNSGFGNNVQSIQVSVTGHCTSSNSALCKINICFSNNGGASCATNANQIQQLTLPLNTDSTQTVGNLTAGTNGYDPLIFFSNPPMSRWRISTRTTKVTVSGSTVTRSATLPATPGSGGQDYFIDDYTNGGSGRIRLSTASEADACDASSTSSEFFISSGFGNSVNLTASPGGSPTFACMPDWAIMIQRASPDVATTVDIQNVNISYLSNYDPGWWDVGFESFCDPTSIQSGFLCMFISSEGGTFSDWFNPATGQVNALVGMSLTAKSTGANTWGNGNICPSSGPDLFQTFDSSQALPTWYCVIQDSGGNFIVVQATFLNTSFVSTNNLLLGKITGNSSPTASDDYSDTYSTATPPVKLIDMTPSCVNKGSFPNCQAGSNNRSIASLISAFTGQTFDQYFGQSGDVPMTCSQGTAQMGTLNFFCYRGQGSIAWIGVFAPGDGNPAHAGCAANTINCNGITGNNVGATAGPGLVGVYNTSFLSPNSFNSVTGTNSVRWGNLHSVGDSGVSGHYDAGIDKMGSLGSGTFNCTDVPPLGSQDNCFGSAFQETTSIVTTNTTIPNTGTDCAVYGNPLGLTGTICQEVQINANGNGMNKYEPYYWILTMPQTQNSAELNTAQVGDIVCVAIYPDGCEVSVDGASSQSNGTTSWTNGVAVLTVSGSSLAFRADSTISVSGCTPSGWNVTNAPLLGVDGNTTKVIYALASNPGSSPGSTCTVTDGTNTRTSSSATWKAGAATYPIPAAIFFGENNSPVIISQCVNTAFNTNPAFATEIAYNLTTTSYELDTNPGAGTTGCNLNIGLSDVWQLVQKNANGLWVFQRNVSGISFPSGEGYPSWQVAGAQPIVMSFNPTVSNVSAGGLSTSGESAWTWATDPNGLTAGGLSTGPGRGHGYGRAYNNMSISTFPHINTQAYVTGYQPTFPVAGPTNQQFITANPGYNGLFPVIPGAFQSHPSPPGDSSPAIALATGYDFRPLIGQTNSTPSGATLFSLVGGASQLYVATPQTVTNSDDVTFDTQSMVFHRKVFATHALSSNHPLLDVSGIGSTIADGSAFAYTYCIVRLVNECVNSSTVGQVYVNIPGLVFPYCFGSSSVGQTLAYVNDICIFDMNPVYQGDVQAYLNRWDPYGQYQRVLVKTMTGQGRFLFNDLSPTPFSIRSLPDNSWTLFGCHYFDGVGRNTCMGQMPPLAGFDNQSRDQYIPYNVNLNVPAGLPINNVLVQFGYQELMQNGVPLCTTRNDACFANASAIPQGDRPYVFQSDGTGSLVSGITGLSCTSAAQCTIPIPAMSNRILYYQVFYRNSANVILSTIPWQAFPTN